MTDTDACLACDAGETECLEKGGCCVSCDHRPELDDSALPDDVALPGLEHDQDRQWSKTQSGYLSHLAGLDYGDGWTFWSLAALAYPEIAKSRAQFGAAEVEVVWLTRSTPHGIRQALIRVATGQVLHDVAFQLGGEGRNG